MAKRQKSFQELIAELMPKKRMLVYTDASYSEGNSGISYFFKLENDSIEYELNYAKLNSKHFKGQLNPNTAEMISILRVLDVAKQKEVDEIIVMTDSQLAIRNFGKKSNLEGRKKSLEEYKESTRNFVKKTGCKVALVYVPAHSSILGNEICDELAKKGKVLDSFSMCFNFDPKKTKPTKVIFGQDETGELIINEAKRYPTKNEQLDKMKYLIKSKNILLENPLIN